MELEGAALPWLRWRVTEVYAPEELRAEALAAQAAGDVQRVAWIARVHAEAVASAPDVEEAWYRWVRRWRLTPSAALASEMESWLVERLQEAASAGEHQRVITLAEWLDTRELEGWEPTLRARLEGRTLAAEAALQVVAASLHQRHQERTEAEDVARGLYDPVAQVFVVREDTLAAREAGLGTWWFGRVQLTPQPGGPSLLEVLPQCRQLEEPCRLSFVDLVRSRVRYLAWTAEGVGDAQEATGR